MREKNFCLLLPPIVSNMLTKILLLIIFCNLSWFSPAGKIFSYIGDFLNNFERQNQKAEKSLLNRVSRRLFTKELFLKKASKFFLKFSIRGRQKKYQHSYRKDWFYFKGLQQNISWQPAPWSPSFNFYMVNINLIWQKASELSDWLRGQGACLIGLVRGRGRGKSDAR